MGDRDKEEAEESIILVLLLVFELGFHYVAQATLPVCLSLWTHAEYDPIKMEIETHIQTQATRDKHRSSS